MRKVSCLLLIILIVFSGCSKKDRLDAAGVSLPWFESEELLTIPTASSTPTESAQIPETEPPEVTEPVSTEATEAEESDVPCGMQKTSLALSDGRTVHCWLYVPEAPGANPGLIVYLHGGSGKGDDLDLITNAGGFPQYLQSGQLGSLSSYVLIPQLPKNLKGWSDLDSTLMDMIQTVVGDYGINAANIALTGHSMGGTGAWSIAAAHPGFFARVAPLSGSIRNTPENVQALKNIPVYAFVGTEDTIVNPQTSLEFVKVLLATGGNAEVVEIEGADHFAVPGLAYLGSYGLIDWLEGK